MRLLIALISGVLVCIVLSRGMVKVLGKEDFFLGKKYWHVKDPWKINIGRTPIITVAVFSIFFGMLVYYLLESIL